jgi:hypothetical protein
MLYYQEEHIRKFGEVTIFPFNISNQLSDSRAKHQTPDTFTELVRWTKLVRFTNF